MKKKSLRGIALALAGVMTLSLTACGGGGGVSSNNSGSNTDKKKEVKQEVGEITKDPEAPPKDAPVGGQFVVRVTPGGLSPDMKDGWSANLDNRLIQNMMNGYGLTARTRDRQIVWNDVVVKEHNEEEQADGSVIYTVKLNEGLKWSDGSEITAKDYLFAIMYQSSKNFAEVEGDATKGNVLVGFNEFNSAKAKEFKGLRLLGDYEFSMHAAAENFPNYYALLDVGYEPDPMAAIAPGVDIKDDGNGCYFTDEFTTELLRKTLLDPKEGFRYKRPVVCGPYKLKKVDIGTETVELEINKEYVGDMDGTKPHIASIITKPIPPETWRDEFEKGNVSYYSASKPENIDVMLSKIEKGEVKANYKQIALDSLDEWRFACDFGPAQFPEVRRAFMYILDRDEINKQTTGGYANIVDCVATEAMKDYQDTKDELEDTLTHYSYDLDKAKEELVKGGWTLNEKGGEFKEGTDKIRYKKVDGKLMPLILKWCYTENATTTLYNTMVPPEAEKVGMKLEGTKMDFAQMITHLNRESGEATYNVFSVSVVLPEESSWWYFFDDAPERMGLWNYYRVSDKELKEITAKMQKVEPGDTESYQKLFVEFEKEFNKKVPGAVMATGTQYWFVDPKFKNFVPRSYDNWSYMVLDSYIEE